MGLALVLASCASKKAVVESQGSTLPKSSAATTRTGNKGNTAQPASQKTDASTGVSAMAFMKKVLDNQVYAKNVVGNMTFNIKMGSKDISVPGSVHMRRDEVFACNCSSRCSAPRWDAWSLLPTACSSSTACTRNTSRPATTSWTS